MKDINATVIVNLDPFGKDLFGSLKRSVRKGIRMASKSGLIVEESEEWEQAYKVYEKRYQKNKIIPESVESLKEKGDKLFVCLKDGEIVGMNVTWFSDIFDKNIPRVLASSVLEEFSKYRPNDLMYWSIFLHYKRRGFKEFDLGGWQINPRENLDNVNKFKENFGQVVYFYKDYSFLKAIGRKLIRNFDLCWNLKRKLKKEKRYAIE